MNDPLLRLSNVYSRLSDPQDRYQARIAFGITGDQLVTEMQRQDPTFNLVQLSEIQRLDHPSVSVSCMNVSSLVLISAVLSLNKCIMYQVVM